jgi:hypothetical protein
VAFLGNASCRKLTALTLSPAGEKQDFMFQLRGFYWKLLPAEEGPARCNKWFRG